MCAQSTRQYCTKAGDVRRARRVTEGEGPDAAVAELYNTNGNRSTLCGHPLPALTQLGLR